MPAFVLDHTVAEAAERQKIDCGSRSEVTPAVFNLAANTLEVSLTQDLVWYC
jgi:hypothetical protein